MRKQTNYYEIIAVDDDSEIIMLDYIFDDGGGFRGATGTRFEAISKEQYGSEVLGDEYFEDCMLEIWKEVVAAGNTEYGLKDFCAGFDEEERARHLYDNSYLERHSDIREALGLNEEEAYTFACTGGGRMFSKNCNYKKVLNPGLLELIRNIES